MDPSAAKLCQIRGKVQGVWYRAWTVREAERRGLRGWVRNLRNGDVEALFAGSAEKVADMIEACYQGPNNARVENITVEDCSAIIPQDFTQYPDA